MARGNAQKNTEYIKFVAFIGTAHTKEVFFGYRVKIVKKILVFYGLPEDKIVVIANGGDNYEVEPNSLENWKNRRVEFFIETKEE